MYEVKCTTEWAHKCQLSVATNSTKYVRLGMRMGVFVGHVVPSEVNELIATKELEDCRLLSGTNNERQERK
jgi:hypothetical protein